MAERGGWDRRYAALALCCGLFLIALGQRPGREVPRLDLGLPLPGDKIAHFLAYGFYAALLWRAAVPPGGRRAAALPDPAAFTVCVVAATGALDELLQGVADRGRTMELWDWAADCAGAAAVCAAGAWERRRARGAGGR
ncbi:MAG: VanZ family protein [Candidatus Sumerlaeia bacterium]|nr:VanZ family protein [Candidatus Sumerlaeia bacterium]